jgi:hypothetical protein
VVAVIAGLVLSLTLAERLGGLLRSGDGRRIFMYAL